MSCAGLFFVVEVHLGIYTSRLLFRYAERFQKVLEELTNRSSLGVGENNGMYSCGQRTGDPIIGTHSTFEYMCSSSLFFYTSMGSVLQGGCYSSILFVFYEKSDVVLLLESTQQWGRCFRAMLYFYEDCVEELPATPPGYQEACPTVDAK